MSEPSTPFAYPDDADEHAAATVGERGEAVRGVLQLIGEGRTASARLLRVEVLALLLRVGSVGSVAEIARRCDCTERRVFAVLAELRNFIADKS